jgi:hypothetical protein
VLNTTANIAAHRASQLTRAFINGDPIAGAFCSALRNSRSNSLRASIRTGNDVDLFSLKRRFFLDIDVS